MKKVFFELFEVTEENGGRIQLKKDINHKLIAEEWDNIQHIVCSLSRKTTIKAQSLCWQRQEPKIVSIA